jgi:hypothetical protein
MALYYLRPGLFYLAYAGTGGLHALDYPSDVPSSICDYEIVRGMYQQRMLTGVETIRVNARLSTIRHRTPYNQYAKRREGCGICI